MLLKNLLTVLNKQSLYYIVLFFLSKSITLLMLPFYTKVLTPSNYATIGLMSGIIDVITALYTLQLNTGYMRVFFDLNKKERIKLKGFVYSKIIKYFIYVSLITFIMYFIFLQFAKDYINNFELKWIYLLLTFMSSLFMIFFQFEIMEFRLLDNHFLFFKYSIISIVLNLIFGILFVISLKMQVFGFFLSQFISYMILFSFFFKKIIMSIKIYYHTGFSKSYEVMWISKENLKTRIIESLNIYFDRYVLSLFFHPSIVGKYSLANSFASNFKSLYSAYMNYYYSVYMKNHEAKKLLILYFVFSLILFFIVFLINHYFIYFLDKKYWDLNIYIKYFSYLFLLRYIEYTFNLEIHFLKRFDLQKKAYLFSIFFLPTIFLFVYFWKIIGMIFYLIFIELIILLFYFQINKFLFVKLLIINLFFDILIWEFC